MPKSRSRKRQLPDFENDDSVRVEKKLSPEAIGILPDNVLDAIPGGVMMNVPCTAVRADHGKIDPAVRALATALDDSALNEHRSNKRKHYERRMQKKAKNRFNVRGWASDDYET